MKGIASGLISSVGAATAQAIQAGIGVFSLNLVASGLVDHKGRFSFVSGVFLCCLGIQIFLNASSINDTKTVALSRSPGSRNIFLGDYGSALLLTIINPLSILPFVAFFTQTYSVRNPLSSVGLEAFVPGVFISTALWHGMVSVGVNLFSQRILLSRLRLVNQIAGISIAAFGCVSIRSAWS